MLFCLHSHQSFEIFFTNYCCFLLEGHNSKKIKRYQIMYLLKCGTLTKTKISKLWCECREKTHITPLIRELYHNGDSSNGKIVQIQLSESVINFFFTPCLVSTDLLYGRSFWEITSCLRGKQLK